MSGLCANLPLAEASSLRPEIVRKVRHFVCRQITTATAIKNYQRSLPCQAYCSASSLQIAGSRREPIPEVNSPFPLKLKRDHGFDRVEFQPALSGLEQDYFPIRAL